MTRLSGIVRAFAALLLLGVASVVIAVLCACAGVAYSIAACLRWLADWIEARAL